MKKILLFATMLLITGSFSCNRSSSLKKAKMAESTGNLQDANSLYIDALFKMALSMKMPDLNRSKFLDRSLWKKEVEKYIVWISTNHPKLSRNIKDVLEGIDRCAQLSQSDNRLVFFDAKELSSEQYLAQWNKTFFAKGAVVNAEHANLASGNHIRNISFITLTSAKSYTYEVSLINKSNGTRTENYLYPESSVSFLASPGDYFLICRSSVTFPSGELWRSQFTVIPIKVPPLASIVTGELRTSVDR